MDFRTLVLANVIVQTLLAVSLVFAAYLARKKDFRRHCAVMRVAVLVQLAAIIAVMWPSFRGYTTPGVPISFFYIEDIVHHSLGLGVVAIWLFVNLAQSGVIKYRRRLLVPMRVALVFWAVAFVLGLHIYFQLWV